MNQEVMNFNSSTCWRWTAKGIMVLIAATSFVLSAFAGGKTEIMDKYTVEASAALNWLSRQQKGKTADMSSPDSTHLKQGPGQAIDSEHPTAKERPTPNEREMGKCQKFYKV